ncbi:MAG TPA: hypothetical protein VLG48_08765, partial [Candidatus Methylomirabilis sp.]|nr:hypothetical protein [Candidatus Methylomirabilis sp.]
MNGILDMAGTRKGDRELPARAARILGGILALLLPASQVAAEGLSLLATSGVSANGADAGGQSVSTVGLNQYLDVNYNRSVTPLLGYRLRFVGSANESWFSSGSTDIDSTAGSVEPIGEVTLTGGRYTLIVGGRLRESYTDTSQSPSILLTDDYEYIKGLFTPDLLPAFNFQFEHTGQQDDATPRGLDRDATRSILGASYTFAQKLNLAYTFTYQTEDNAVTGLSRDQYSNIGSASYADSFFQNRLSVDGSYFISQVNTTESGSAVVGAGGILLLPRILSGAFSLVEDTPTVAAGSKVPVASYTTLTTSTATTLGFSVPLVVDQGGTLGLNQSIAFGLTPGISVTTIRLTVSVDARVTNGQVGGVSFQVLVGNSPAVNSTTWTAVSSTIVRRPTTVDPFFEITIGATTGNFLKVHVAGDTQQGLGSLTATAVTALGPTAVVGQKVSLGSLVQNLVGGVTVRPIEALTLGGNVNYSTFEEDPSGRRDSNLTYAVTATGTPHRLLSATANYQNTSTDSDDPFTPTTGQWIGSLTLTSTPLPTLTASLSGSRTENSLGGNTQNRIDSLSLNTSLKPYRNLNTDVTASVVDAKSFLDGTEGRQYTAGVSANAILTPRLTGLLGYTFVENEVQGGIAPASATTNLGFLQLTYTISRLMNATGRWDFNTTNGTTAVTQQYQLSLIPTQ